MYSYEPRWLPCEIDMVDIGVGDLGRAWFAGSSEGILGEHGRVRVQRIGSEVIKIFENFLRWLMYRPPGVK